MNSLRIITLLSILGLTVSAVGQPEPGWPQGGGPNRRHIRERIKTVKIWKLTEELNLSSKQSEQFFPLYNQFQDDRQQIDSNRMETLQKLDELTSTENPSDSEINSLLQKLDDYDAQMNAKQIRFREKLKGIITTRQIGRLYVFEIKFQNQMREIVRDAMMEGREKRFKEQP
jgi:Spy/CpxP family protein refolding chaperone